MRKGLSGEGGALPPPRRLRASAWPLRAAPRVAQRGRGHPWEGAPGAPALKGRRVPGLSLSLRPARAAGALTNLGLFFVSSSLAARLPTLRLLLRPPLGSSPPPPAPDAAAPGCSIFLGPVTCALSPHLASTEEAPRGGPAAPRGFGSTSPREGVYLSREQQISGPRDSGIPGTPDATRRCHYSAPGQALPLSSCNYHYRRRPQGGV